MLIETSMIGKAISSAWSTVTSNYTSSANVGGYFSELNFYVHWGAFDNLLSSFFELSVLSSVLLFILLMTLNQVELSDCCTTLRCNNRKLIM